MYPTSCRRPWLTGNQVPLARAVIAIAELRGALEHRPCGRVAARLLGLPRERLGRATR